MATINSFPNNSDEYIGAEEVMRWLHGRTSGVYAAGGNAAVTAVSSTMTVSVAPGIGWLTDADGNGIVWWSTAAQVLSIDAAHTTLNRIDRIVVEWYVGDYSDKPEIKVLKGTESSTPSAPALTNTSLYRQISLAQVSIPAGTTELTNLLITDERTDPSVCGIVTESVTADTTVINAQYQEALAELLDAISQAWGGVISDGAITYAKLAAAVQNMIGVKSVNGESGVVVLDADDVGAMSKWDLLWTNASPSSSFASQTIPLDLSGYDLVAIRWIKAGSNNGQIAIYNIDADRWQGSPLTIWAGSYSPTFEYRGVSVTTTGVEFGDNKTKGTSTSAPVTTNGNNYPLYIYGIKGVITT